MTGNTDWYVGVEFAAVIGIIMFYTITYGVVLKERLKIDDVPEYW
ncbi:MAG: hypothetical protein ACYDAJ_09135 [Nitrosotalea sp.]